MILFLNLVTQAEKHLQIRQDAESRYMAMLERACEMFANQILGPSDTSDNKDSYEGKETKVPPTVSSSPLDSYPSQSADELGIKGPREVSPKLHPQRTDCSTESCLTSHGSPVGLLLEGSSPGGKRTMLSMDSANASFGWGESALYPGFASGAS